MRRKRARIPTFALLSTIRFTEPFKEPIEYARSVAGLANLISGGSVLVQRLGDLLAGRRTDAKRLAQSTVRPTLNAVAGRFEPLPAQSASWTISWKHWQPWIKSPRAR